MTIRYIDNLSQDIFDLLCNINSDEFNFDVILNYYNRKKIMDKIKSKDQDQWERIIKKLFQNKTIRNSFRLQDKNENPVQNTYSTLKPWLEAELTEFIIFLKKNNLVSSYDDVLKWTSDLYHYFKTKNYRIHYKILSDQFDMKCEKIEFKNGCFIRQITQFEKDELLKDSDRFHLDPFIVMNSNCMIGITSKANDQKIKPEKELEFLVKSLRLFKTGYFDYSGTFQKSTKKWEICRGAEWKEIRFRTRKKYALNQEECKKFIRFYNWLTKKEDLINNLPLKSKKSKLERKLMRIALNRFNFSMERDTAEDELIDLVVCLEAIFSEASGDLRWKVPTRCARLLGSTESRDKLRLQGFIKKMYDLRSDIVHGSKQKAEIKINELIELNEIARRSIKKGLKLSEKVNSDDIYKLFDFGVNKQTYKLINTYNKRQEKEVSN